MQTLENNLKIFENKEFGKIRVAIIGETAWFVGRNIANILGYGNGNSRSKALTNAIKDHVDEEDKRKLNYNECVELFGKYQNGDPNFKINSNGMIIINESGLYSLVLSSKLPQAKAFKRWITSEVLPSLRKNGYYGMLSSNPSDFFNNPDAIITMAQNWKNEIEKNKVLQLENNELKEDKIILENKNLQLKETNEELTLNNKVLAEEILTWDNRAILNKTIRAIAIKLKRPYGVVWNMLYDELKYKYHISLKQRGKSPFIQHIKENEWSKALAIITAICEDNDLNFAEIVNKEFNVD